MSPIYVTTYGQDPHLVPCLSNSGKFALVTPRAKGVGVRTSLRPFTFLSPLLVFPTVPFGFTYRVARMLTFHLHSTYSSYIPSRCI